MQVTNGLSSGVGFEGEILSELDYWLYTSAADSKDFLKLLKSSLFAALEGFCSLIGSK
jgi:hypothetical protein